ncbi:snoRNA-binding protein [Trapelia coarctata]|nr:snoRNA-binding protein [Trapelia coarctata]
MAKEKSAEKSERKKDKKDKKEKRSEKDGVHKSKKDKKEKKPIPAPDSESDVAPVAAPILEKVTNGDSAKKGPENGEMEIDIKAKPAQPLVGALVPFANPLADEKVGKKVLKSVKKAAKNKSLKRGVKEVVKSLRKSAPATTSTTASPPGIVVLAADISPMDVISHIPVLCEDHGIPYIFVPSRAELGAAGSTKRPTSVVMVSKEGGKKGKEEKKEGEDDFAEVYADLVKVVLKASKDVRI